MLFDLRTAAKEINGRQFGKNVIIQRIVCDSRLIQKGDLFVALKGDRFNAHDFVADALKAGAAAAMISERYSPDLSPVIVVEDDTKLGFGRLASWWRKRFQIPVLAVTGSSGKTTVKEMINTILCRYYGEDKVLSTIGNLNNDIGVPMTLLRLNQRHKVAVVELGMNNIGEISYLSKMVAPTIGVINNVGEAHIGSLGTLERIAQAKGELLNGLTNGGKILLNMDDVFFDYWAKRAGENQIISFGLTEEAKVSAKYIVEETESKLKIYISGDAFEFSLPVPGLHNVRNAVAATAAALALKIPASDIASGLSNFRPMHGRLNTISLSKNICLIDDSYNSNPDSMRAAIEVLSKMAGKKILIMGEMGDLGERTRRLHQEIGKFALNKGLDQLHGIGESVDQAVASFGVGGKHYQDFQEFVKVLPSLVSSDINILVKGSRFTKLDRVVTRIRGLCEVTAGGGK